jgi:hypothetical protein
MEYDVQHPVPVSSMLMFGDIHPRAGTGHYYVNAGLTESSQISTSCEEAGKNVCLLPYLHVKGGGAHRWYTLAQPSLQRTIPAHRHRADDKKEQGHPSTPLLQNLVYEETRYEVMVPKVLTQTDWSGCPGSFRPSCPTWASGVRAGTEPQPEVRRPQRSRSQSYQKQSAHRTG